MFGREFKELSAEQQKARPGRSEGMDSSRTGQSVALTTDSRCDETAEVGRHGYFLYDPLSNRQPVNVNLMK